MLPTPSTSHIPSQVYPPSEDSYLLLDTLSSPRETTFLSTRFPSSAATPLLVELGTGSGVVLAFLLANAQAILDRSDVISLGIDVNPYACRAARETICIAKRESEGERNEVTDRRRGESGQLMGTLQADLLSPLRDGSVDVLVFNPPYVPTDSLPEINPLEPEQGQEGQGIDIAFREESRLLELTYAGGEQGMETTERFLEEVPRMLSARGVFYLLLCMGNRPDEVRKRIEGWDGGWRVEEVGRSGKTAGWEKLVALRGWRP
ncbi:MAG: S-adenosylmethionine-dependent methyltransferase [Stictis urceolatum]|nr:S-adenosylmethionine-dependent methyltransferase [Stictis urceolata]